MKKIQALFVAWIQQGFHTSMRMFRIMVPITILVKILQETGLIVYVGEALSPLMKWMGLPGEMGLVWASSMISNVYGGLIAYFSLAGDVSLNTAQVTVLSTIILIAHTFPIELVVTKKAGVKLLPMFLFRFGFGLLAGVLMYWTYHFLGVLEGSPEVANTLFVAPQNQNYLQWALGEAKNYAFIYIWITGLIIVLDVLQRIRVIDIINKMLHPALRVLGIGKDVIPITVVGMTLGIAYGGGLIIHKVNEGGLNKRDVFYALVLMSLCHSMIEDSLLMMSIGAHFTGVFLFRIVFALVVTYLIVRITRLWSETRMRRWFYS